MDARESYFNCIPAIKTTSMGLPNMNSMGEKILVVVNCPEIDSNLGSGMGLRREKSVCLITVFVEPSPLVKSVYMPRFGYSQNYSYSH